MQCHTPLSIVHQALCLSELVPWISFSLPLIWFRSYLNGLLVFPTFFNFSLNLAIRTSWSEPQSAPGLDLLTVWSFSVFGCKEYNQSDFSVGHLVMSMCRVFSCAWGILIPKPRTEPMPFAVEAGTPGPPGNSPQERSLNQPDWNFLVCTLVVICLLGPLHPWEEEAICKSDTCPASRRRWVGMRQSFVSFC